MIKVAVAAFGLVLAGATPAMGDDLLAGDLVPAKVQPQPPWSRPNQFVVSTHDLDLNSEDDARVVLARIERAAAELCGRRTDIVHPVQIRWRRECVDEAVRGAVARLDEPVVSAAHLQTRASSR